MAERFNAPVLKTDVVKATGGSNPSSSANPLCGMISPVALRLGFFHGGNSGESDEGGQRPSTHGLIPTDCPTVKETPALFRTLWQYDNQPSKNNYATLINATNASVLLVVLRRFNS